MALVLVQVFVYGAQHTVLIDVSSGSGVWRKALNLNQDYTNKSTIIVRALYGLKSDGTSF